MTGLAEILMANIQEENTNISDGCLIFEQPFIFIIEI